MKQIYILASLFLLSCANQNSSTAQNREFHGNRGLASVDESEHPEAAPEDVVPEWIDHPCRVSGAPYKKYESFLVKDGVLYGRANGDAKPVEIKEKPKDGSEWGNPEQFLREKILSFCNGIPANEKKIF